MPIVKVFVAGVPRLESGKVIAPGDLIGELTIPTDSHDAMRSAAKAVAMAYAPGRRVRACSAIADGSGFSVTLTRKD